MTIDASGRHGGQTGQTGLNRFDHSSNQTKPNQTTCQIPEPNRFGLVWFGLNQTPPSARQDFGYSMWCEMRMRGQSFYIYCFTPTVRPVEGRFLTDRRQEPCGAQWIPRSKALLQGSRKRASTCQAADCSISSKPAETVHHGIYINPSSAQIPGPSSVCIEVYADQDTTRAKTICERRFPRPEGFL